MYTAATTFLGRISRKFSTSSKALLVVSQSNSQSGHGAVDEVLRTFKREEASLNSWVTRLTFANVHLGNVLKYHGRGAEVQPLEPFMVAALSKVQDMTEEDIEWTFFEDWDFPLRETREPVGNMELTKLERGREELRRQVWVLKAESVGLRAKVTKLETEAKEFNTESVGLRAKVTKLETEAKEFNTETQKLSQQLSQQYVEFNKRLSQQYIEFSRKLNEQNVMIQEQNSRSNQQDSRIQEQDSRIQEQNSTIQELNKKMRPYVLFSTYSDYCRKVQLNAGKNLGINNFATFTLKLRKEENLYGPKVWTRGFLHIRLKGYLKTVLITEFQWTSSMMFVKEKNTLFHGVRYDQLQMHNDLSLLDDQDIDEDEKEMLRAFLVACIHMRL